MALGRWACTACSLDNACAVSQTAALLCASALPHKCLATQARGLPHNPRDVSGALKAIFYKTMGWHPDWQELQILADPNRNEGHNAFLPPLAERSPTKIFTPVALRDEQTLGYLHQVCGICCALRFGVARQSDVG